MLARHWALRKYGLQNSPWGGGKPYPASGLNEEDATNSATALNVDCRSEGVVNTVALFQKQWFTEI